MDAIKEFARTEARGFEIILKKEMFFQRLHNYRYPTSNNW